MDEMIRKAYNTGVLEACRALIEETDECIGDIGSEPGMPHDALDCIAACLRALAEDLDDIIENQKKEMLKND